jgi:hypothetical protein
MEPAEFISFASRVVAYSKAGARSAVSRAYYGAFHKALSVLADFGCAPASNADYRLADTRVESLEFAKLSVESASDACRHVDALRDACRDAQVLDELRGGIAELRLRRQC